MASFISLDPSARSRNFGSISLAFFWTLGLILGTFTPLAASDSVLFLMKSALLAPVSILVLLSTVLLPFLCVAIAVSVSAPEWLLCICFCKAFCFSAISVLVFSAFGSAGWLIRCLLLFSDMATAPLLYSFCRRHLSCTSRLNRYDFSTAISAVGFCLLDWAYISPFLSEIIIL